MESISGLPAHPLFVHAPVVLMPLAAIATLVLAVRPEWRRRSGIALAVGAVAVLIVTQLAVSSGEAFDDIVGDRVDTSEHRSLGLATRNLIALFALATIAMAGFDRWHRRSGPSWLPNATWAAVALAGISGMLATVWMIRTGDVGARLVWDGIIDDSLRPFG